MVILELLEKKLKTQKITFLFIWSFVLILTDSVHN
jgi:hypothetical protein